jgi:Metallo-beta-lactamase superfamily
VSDLDIRTGIVYAWRASFGRERFAWSAEALSKRLGITEPGLRIIMSAPASSAAHGAICFARVSATLAIRWYRSHFTAAAAVALLVARALVPLDAGAAPCSRQGVELQVLGSGGPELEDKRASSSYIVWQDGRPRILVDSGGGSALRFGQADAQVAQLDAILFSHLHIDHSADFAAVIKSSYFEERHRVLPVYGPSGNTEFPSTTQFVASLFDRKRGASTAISETSSAGGMGGIRCRRTMMPLRTLGAGKVGSAG